MTAFASSFLVDYSQGPAAVHPDVQLRGGERVGGLAEQNLREQQATIRHVPSLCINQRCLDVVSRHQYEFKLRANYSRLSFSCNESDPNNKGCKSLDETPLEVDLLTQLDPARDLQRLHTLIITNMNVMQKFFDSNLDEEKVLTRQTLQDLSKVAMHLEQIHRKHRNKENKEMKIGSQQEPIGDDNYLRGMSSSSLNSGASTTPRPTPTQHFDIQPALFQRGHFLRNSDSERFSNF